MFPCQFTILFRAVLPISKTLIWYELLSVLNTILKFEFINTNKNKRIFRLKASHIIFNIWLNIFSYQSYQRLCQCCNKCSCVIVHVVCTSLIVPNATYAQALKIRCLMFYSHKILKDLIKNLYEIKTSTYKYK